MANGHFSATNQPSTKRSGKTQSTRIREAIPDLVEMLLAAAIQGDPVACAAIINYQNQQNK